MAEVKTFHPHDVVNRYFELIGDLRNGKQEAVKKLVDLWAEDGVFEFAGAEPVTGIYKGRNAIHVLYKNRVAACGMPLKIAGDGATTMANVAREVALGIVDTQVNRMRTIASRRAMSQADTNSSNQRVAVGWTTAIGTSDQRGFQVSGNHIFVFKEEKISSLKVTVSPKADSMHGLSLEGLTVTDIGRLSLAAWAVV